MQRGPLLEAEAAPHKRKLQLPNLPVSLQHLGEVLKVTMSWQAQTWVKLRVLYQAVSQQ